VERKKRNRNYNPIWNKKPRICAKQKQKKREKPMQNRKYSEKKICGRIRTRERAEKQKELVNDPMLPNRPPKTEAITMRARGTGKTKSIEM